MPTRATPSYASRERLEPVSRSEGSAAAAKCEFPFSRRRSSSACSRGSRGEARYEGEEGGRLAKRLPRPRRTHGGLTFVRRSLPDRRTLQRHDHEIGRAHV